MARSGANEIKAGAAYVEINADDAKLRQGLRGAKAAMSRFSADIARMGRGMIIAGAAALAPMIAAIKKTGDYQEILSKFRAVFKEHAAGAEEWSRSFAKSIGRSRIDVLSYMAAMQDTFVPLGFARDKAMDLAKAVSALAIDMASFNNAADEEVLRGLQSALVGNHETVRRYGVIITQATLNQELLNMGIADGVKKATNQQKVMARLNIIMKGTTDAQGDAARTAGSYANQVKRLRASVSNLLVTLGEHLIPTVTRWITNINAAVTRGEEWIRNNKAAIITYIKLAATIAAVGAALLILGKTVGIVMFMFSPAGALGIAIAGILMLLDSLGVINTGFTDFLQNVRVGGHKISTWMQTAWIEVFKGWEWLKNSLITGQQFLLSTFESYSLKIFQSIIWVPQKILEGFDRMIADVVDKLNWLVDQINKLPYMGVGKIAKPEFAKDAAKFFTDLSKGAASASSDVWDRFEKNRQTRAKETGRVIAALQGAQNKLFKDDIMGIKNVAAAAATATAGAAVPGMPTMAGGGAGGGGAVFGTFAGRAAAGFAGGSAVDRESLRVEKAMAQILRIIAENTKSLEAVYG